MLADVCYYLQLNGRLVELVNRQLQAVIASLRVVVYCEGYTEESYLLFDGVRIRHVRETSSPCKWGVGLVNFSAHGAPRSAIQALTELLCSQYKTVKSCGYILIIKMSTSM